MNEQLLKTFPEKKREILDTIINELKKIENVAAIVLGGSYAVGTATETSDLDIGLYYYEKSPFKIEEIKLVVQKFSIEENPAVTGFYEWGAWVNGGAWINTQTGEVDFLYKNIDQVRSTIEKSKKGIWENDYEQQPPFGFSSVIYLAETLYCIPLHDPDGIVQQLKDEVKHYPSELKKTIVQMGLWSAEFALWQAEKFASKQDTLNAVGCFTRILKSLTDVLFALNETYSMGDKNAMQRLLLLPIKPDHLKQKIDGVLDIEINNVSINSAKLRSLFDEIVTFAGDGYKPFFKL